MLRRYVKKILAGAMAAVIALSVPLAAGAEELLLISPAPSGKLDILIAPSTEVALQEALDFSREGATHAQSQAAVTLMEAMGSQWTGSAVSAEEIAYLASEDIVLRYDEAVSGGLVSTTVEGGVLTVTAHAESYTANNGETVTWIPDRVKIGTEEKTLAVSADGERYEAVFSGLDTTVLHTAQLFWRAALTLSGETVSTLINRTYGDAAAMIAAQETYEADIQAYEAAMTRYRAEMATYEAQNAVYQEYLKKLSAYETELAAYNDYLAKVKAYEDGVAAYAAYQTALTKYQQDYAAYQTTLSGMQAQQEAYNRYQQYLSQVEQATAKLAVMESIFVTDSTGRSMYATLMGDTVATVVARKSELIAGGADARDVDNAGAATTKLQSLLTAYRAQSSDQAKYNWYKNNYRAVTDAFITLYSSLHSLYQNTVVRTVLNMQGKLERYCQFVSQLYVISTGLDDTTSFDPSWKIQLSKSSWGTPGGLLESCQLLSDTNAASPTVTWPAAVAEVAKPTLPTAPTKPAEVAEPVKTWTQVVTAPTGKPAAVAQPVQPLLSDYTAGEPTKPTATAELLAVMALVESGKLTERTKVTEKVTLEVETSRSRSVTLSEQPTVTFYNEDGKTICYAVNVTEGSPVFYEGEEPTRAADAQYTYTFAGWVDAQGNAADFSAIRQDTDFFAVYDKTVNRYTVTWEIMGKKVEQEYAYGEIPSYRDWEQVFTDDTYEYTFTGWSTAVRQVTGDATYTALFRVSALAEASYAVTFTVGDRQVYRTYAYGETPAFDEFEKEYISGDSHYTFIGWDKEFAPLTADMQYTAQFARTWLVPAGENGEVGAQVSETSQTLSVVTDEMVVDITWAMAQASEKGLSLSLTLGDATLTLDAASVRALESAAVVRLAPVASADGMSYFLSVVDGQGKTLTWDTEPLLALKLTEEMVARTVFAADMDGKAIAATKSGEVVYLWPTSCGTVSVRAYYAVTVSTEGSGAVLCEATDILAGNMVLLTLHSEQGWRLASLEAVTADGMTLDMAGESFCMPAADVTVKAVFEQVEYTVVFMNGGDEVSRGIYHYGDTVALPADPVWAGEEKEGMTYTFTGWSPAVLPVTEDVVYTAQYREAVLGDYQSGNNSNKLVTVVLPIMAAAAVLVGATVVVWRVKRKKK